MTVANLSHVTKTMRALLKDRVPQLLDGAPSLTITSKRPESLALEKNTINLYLYHISEDPFYKNQAAPGSGPNAVARTSMGLLLYYIATAQHTDEDTEQAIMGAVLKTFHDHPIIDSETSFDGGATYVMDDALKESGQNWLEITLRPITPEESLNFWNSEQSRTAKLSAYYEVRAVFLEPELPKTYSGTVLSVGTYVIVKNTPVITTTSSQIVITPPVSLGVAMQTVTARPARIAMLTSADKVGNNAAKLTLSGSSFTSGQNTQLVLRHPDFNKLTPPQPEIVIDTALNTANGWAVEIGADEIEVEFGTALTYRNPAGAEQTMALFPGLYSVAVQIDAGQFSQSVPPRAIVERSNFSPIMVGGFVNPPASIADGTSVFTAQLSPAFNIDLRDGAAEPDLSVIILVDGLAYERITDTLALLTAAQFRVSAVAAGPPDANGIISYSNVSADIHLHNEGAQLGVHDLRVIIEGVDAHPTWLEVV